MLQVLHISERTSHIFGKKSDLLIRNTYICDTATLAFYIFASVLYFE